MTSAINIPVYSDALVVLGTAGIVVPLVRRLGVSPVLGYLGAGALLGPLGLGSFIDKAPLLFWFTVVDAERVGAIADLGVVFLLFLIGLELSYERLLSMRRLVFGLGGAQVVICSALLASAALAYGLPLEAAALVGACLALSSTAIVLEVLSGQGRLKAGAGRASFAILLAQDLAVIPLLMFVSILGAKTGGSVLLSVGLALLQAVVAVVIIIVAGRVVMRPVFHVIAGQRSNELFIAAVLFVIIGAGFVAALAGLSMTLGAFVAGLLLAETAYRKAVEAVIEPFKGLLLGVFFLTIGMTFDIRSLAREPVMLLCAVAGLIAVKVLVIALLARLFRLPTAVSIETALLLGPGGEFAFVGVGLATSLALLDAPTANFVIAVTALSMALIPALASLARIIAKKFEARGAPAPELAIRPLELQKHAIVVGYGRVGKVVCALLAEHNVRYTAVDQNAATVIADRRDGREVFFGDATNDEFLRVCGLMEASGLILTIDSPATTNYVIASARAARPDLHIVARARDAAHARRIYALGADHAVHETMEASLQISEAALVGLGKPMGYVIASIHEFRDAMRKRLKVASPVDQSGDSGHLPPA